MPITDPHERANCALAGSQSQFWTDFLLPTLQDKCRQKMEALASEPSDKDNITRGWIQALRWVCNLPGVEVSLAARLEEERTRDNEADERAQHRATFGLRSPIREAPPIGETKESEAQTAS